jgi:Mor family transcriptional regulator
MQRLNWIKDIDWKKELKGDLREIADRTNIEALISLWEFFGKTSVYFSEEALNGLRKKYILLNYKKGKVKELARKLDTSESFVYDTAKGIKRKKKIVN